MQPQHETLGVIYENWRGYNAKLGRAIAPLTAAQLALQPAPHMWPLEQIVQHIISVRAGWFSATLQDEDAAMAAYMEWGSAIQCHVAGLNWPTRSTRRGRSSKAAWRVGRRKSVP